MTTTTDRARITLGPGWRVGLVVLGAALLGVVGWFLDRVTGWAVGQDWLPVGGLVSLLDRAAAAAPLWAQVVVGAGVGVVGGLLLASQATTVEVADDEVVVLEGSRRRRVARSQVGQAVLEGSRLSLRDGADVDLVTTDVEGDVAALRTALVAHGWPVRG